MKKEVFISYSKNDKNIADLICNGLESAEIGCWIAHRDIPYGEDWASEITKAIEKANLFILLLSAHSNKSRQCSKEVNLADNMNTPIICVKIDDVEMNEGLKYHLSFKQTAFIDALSIDSQIIKLVSVIREKFGLYFKKEKAANEHTDDFGSFVLRGGFPIFEDENFEESFDFNVDIELDKKFDELFEEPQDQKITSLVKEQLQKKVEQKFIFEFKENLSGMADNSPDVDVPPEGYERPSLILNKDYEYVCGKNFFLPILHGTKTTVFQIYKNAVDYSLLSAHYNICAADYIEEKEKSVITFYFESLPVEGISLILLHFDYSKNIVVINNGILKNDIVIISKNPMFMPLPKLSIENCELSLSNAAYDSKTVQLMHPNSSSDKQECWVSADIKLAPVIIIDPETAQPVKREIYYDKQARCNKLRIKLKPHKSYFVFQIFFPNTNSSFRALTAYEKGRYYRLGMFGFPKDLMEAAQLLEEDGSSEALYELALIFGRETEFNDEASYYDYLFKAIDLHSENAMIELALGVHAGESHIKSKFECIELLKNELSEDSTAGFFVLACLLESEGLLEAFEYYYRSAKNDFYPAIVRLQCTSDLIVDSFKENLRKAFIKSCASHELFQYCLGHVCYYGIDVERHRSYGLKLLVEASLAGDIYSQKTVFDIYDTDNEYGDKIKALYWLEKVAEFDEDVYVDLANRYIDGVGCEICKQNDKKAFDLLQKSSETGNKTAQNNLAWMYKNGRGCETNYSIALQLFKGAGTASSFYNLGRMFEEGLGVKVDLDKAIEYYKQGAENGSAKAEKRLHELISN